MLRINVLTILLVLAANGSHAQSAVEFLISDVWRKPIGQARIYEGNAPSADSTPLAESGDNQPNPRGALT